MTKDELISKVAKLSTQVSDWKDHDENMRKELSKCLGSLRITTSTYGSEEEEGVVLTWSQIFFKIGQHTDKDELIILRSKIDSVEMLAENINRKILEEEADKNAK